MRKCQILTIVIAFLFFSCKPKAKKDNTTTVERLPNIVIIYADDLGLGDVGSYGSKVLQTPNFDRLANEGIRFTNGYATSPTCTPSRYALLSGTYPFRKQNARVLPGNAPLLFELGKQTLPSMLDQAGYATAVVGKWHLGLGEENMDWNGDIAPGPLEIGFEHAFIMASTNDRVPTVYVEGHSVVGLNPDDPLEVNYQENFPGEPTGKENPEMLKLLPSHGHDMSVHNGISRIGYMRGGKHALFIDEEMSDLFLEKAINFTNNNTEQPFFLFYALHQPHVPRVPNPRFAGKSGLGPRGDAIVEADWATGKYLQALDSLGLAENTIVIFSSDNGPVLDDGYQDQAVLLNGEHDASGGLRGGKYSLFDAGTHVPFIVRWTGTIEPGVSDALVSQLDFVASFAALTGQKNETPDSENTLDAFLGKSKMGRKDIVLGRNDIDTYRAGDWVLIPPHQGPKQYKWVDIESGRDTVYQLYNLKEDPAQEHNLAASQPVKLKEMQAALAAIKNKVSTGGE